MNHNTIRNAAGTFLVSYETPVILITADAVKQIEEMLA